MFKLSMCCALFSMIFLLRRTKLKFNRFDTFMPIFIPSQQSLSYPHSHSLLTCFLFSLNLVLINHLFAFLIHSLSVAPVLFFSYFLPKSYSVFKYMPFQIHFAFSLLDSLHFISIRGNPFHFCYQMLVSV